MMKPWLWLPPQLAHDLAPQAISLYSQICPATPPEWQSFQWQNLFFPNRIGIAGGADKTGACFKSWYRLGCGFTEIGTITPLPQDPNPGVIIQRDGNSLSLWNKMGFPSPGAEVVLQNLEKQIAHKKGPLFINIGKNRNTSLENASEDYKKLVQKFKTLADVFVVNISSPNTQGLRKLQTADYLKSFLAPILESAGSTPVLVKLSPDMNDEELLQTLEICVQCGAKGFVLTNTTLARTQTPQFPVEGGVSGRPLKERSTQVLRLAHQFLQKNRGDYLLVSAGGVFTAEDVFERLHFGADLVEIYTGLVFNGPGLFHKIAGAARERQNQN